MFEHIPLHNHTKTFTNIYYMLVYYSKYRNLLIFETEKKTSEKETTPTNPDP